MTLKKFANRYLTIRMEDIVAIERAHLGRESYALKVYMRGGAELIIEKGSGQHIRTAYDSFVSEFEKFESSTSRKK